MMDSRIRYQRLLLPVFLIALLCVGLVAVASSQPADAAAAELVATPDSSEGFLLFDENGKRKKLWINTSCKRSVVSDGHSFVDRSFNTFSTLPTAAPRACSAIRSLVAAQMGQNTNNTSGANSGPGWELLTYSSSPAGWLVRWVDGTKVKDYMNSACRNELVGLGYSFKVQTWASFRNLPGQAVRPNCGVIKAFLRNNPANPTVNVEPSSARLVTYASSSAGWLIRTVNGAVTKNYMHGSCRRGLISDGYTFETLRWVEFGSLPAAAPNLNCTQVQNFVADNFGATTPSGEGTGPTLLRTGSDTSGWLVRTLNGVRTKQWIDDDCRSQLQGAGLTFTHQAYNTYGNLPTANVNIALECAAIAGLFGQTLNNGGGNNNGGNNNGGGNTDADGNVAVSPPSVPTGPATGQFTIVDGKVYDPNGNEFILRGMNVWADYYSYSGWGANIIEDKDVYLNQWNLNAMRLNVICSSACEGTLQHHLTKNWVTVVDTASVAGDSGGYVIYQQAGTKYRQWVNSECKAELKAAGYGNFPVRGWNGTLRNYQKAPNMACSEHLPIEDIINAYAGEEMVFLIDYHVVDFPHAPTQAEIRASAAYLAELAAKYKNNPYVWFSPFNEPFNECDLDQYGARLYDNNGNQLTRQGIASKYWLDMQKPVVDAIRATGNKNIIVANASNYGQDRCDSQGRFNWEESSIVQYGQQLIDHDPEKKVMFDLHFYSRWSRSDINDMNWYFNELARRKLPVLIGEVGGKCHSQTIFKHDLNAAKKITEMWEQIENPPIGMFAWHAGMGFPMTSARSDDATRWGYGNNRFNGIGTGNQNAGQLTLNGMLWWDWVHPEKNYFRSVPNCWN